MYLDVPFGDKDQVSGMGGRWDATRRAWYVPSGIDATPFARWSEGARPSLVDTYHQMSSGQARYYLLRDNGGVSAGIYLDDLKEARELASGAIEDGSDVELRDNETSKVWRGADILEL